MTSTSPLRGQLSAFRAVTSRSQYEVLRRMRDGGELFRSAAGWELLSGGSHPVRGTLPRALLRKGWVRESGEGYEVTKDGGRLLDTFAELMRG